jgi:hypothetical protein
MPSFILDEILLYSTTERKARRVSFAPTRTIVIGSNDTGKSSLLKSIYHTFGAEPTVVHSSWKAAGVVSMVRFSIDGLRFALLRRGNYFTLFDAGDEAIAGFNSVTRGIGPFLGDLCRFNVRLTSRQGEPVVPPPAYFFLPYYIDQDTSWQSNWAAFARLNQFPNWRRDIIEYHTGIKPDEYYILKHESDRLTEEVSQRGIELKVLRRVQMELKERLARAAFDLDIEAFRKEVDELLAECQGLQELENGFKEKLSELRQRESTLNAQLSIVENAINEMRKDMKYAREIAVEHEVECPTCGAVYANGFAEQFAIADDEDRLLELRLQLSRELESLAVEIESTNERFTHNHRLIGKIQQVLEKKQSEVKLHDVIVSEGRKEVRQIIDHQVADSSGEIARKKLRIKEIQDRLKNLVSGERREEILNFYRTRMDRFLEYLEVSNLNTKDYHDIATSIREMGSDLPRALLAYYFSILFTIKRYSPATFCPIVIDSPNQQAQDNIRLRKMLSFIRDHQPPGSQLVLGVEDLRGIEFDAKFIFLTRHNSLMLEDEFEDVGRQIRPLLDRSFANEREVVGNRFL